jgi:hypothetical protein
LVASCGNESLTQDEVHTSRRQRAPPDEPRSQERPSPAALGVSARQDRGARVELRHQAGLGHRHGLLLHDLGGADGRLLSVWLATVSCGSFAGKQCAEKHPSTHTHSLSLGLSLSLSVSPCPPPATDTNPLQITPAPPRAASRARRRSSCQTRRCSRHPGPTAPARPIRGPSRWSRGPAAVGERLGESVGGSVG